MQPLRDPCAPMTPDDDLTREASRWCVLLHGDDCSAADREAFGRWQAADPRHAAEYAAVLDLWDLSGDLASSARGSRPVVRVPVWRGHGVAVAALSVAALLWTGWFAGWVPHDFRHYGAGDTPRGVVLPDGSAVELNRNSRVSFLQFRDRRSVALDGGEALFEVVHDEARPFTVNANEGAITVVGTRFNVWRNDQRVIVTVLQGAVRVEHDAASSVTVMPGGQARYTRDRAPVTLGQVNAEHAIAWTRGTLVLDDMALADAVPLLNAYLPRPLLPPGPDIEGLRIGGIYDTSAVADLVEALPTVLPVRLVSLPDGRLELRRRPG